MLKRPLAVILVAAVAAGVWFLLNRSGHKATTTTVSTTTTTPTIPVQEYFYLGAGLVPVVVRVPKTGAVATAALRALLAGPPAGYSTAIPAGTRLLGVTTAASVATARFSRELTDAQRTAQGQIVYTLSQFPSVKGVLVDAAGSPVRLSAGDGKTASPATAHTYVDLTPQAPIFVARPGRNSTVTSPVVVSGTAMVFEATFVLEVRSAAGKLLDTQTMTATIGAPGRGTFSTSLTLDPGSYELVFYESSAADGSHLHTTTVDITVV